MKEIKVYIPRCCMNDAVNELEAAGAPGVAVTEIHPVRYGFKPNYLETRFKDALRRYGYLQIVKVEVASADRDADRLVRAIEKVCRKGVEGDGWIFVTEVQSAIRIRDGASAEAPLIEDRNLDETNRFQEVDCK